MGVLANGRAQAPGYDDTICFQELLLFVIRNLIFIAVSQFCDHIVQKPLRLVKTLNKDYCKHYV